MWIIASLPFWIIGFAALLLGIAAFKQAVTSPGPVTNKDRNYLVLSLTCFAIAAVALPIAAKVAS